MLSPLEILKEINLNEKKLLAKNIEVLDGFLYIGKEHQYKDDLSRLELFLDMINNIPSNNEDFATYYVNQLINFSFSQNLFIHESFEKDYENLNIFFRGLCHTFLFKKDMSSIKSKKELEKSVDGSKIMNHYNLFNKTNYSVVNFYLFPLDVLILHRETEMATSTLIIAIQNIYKEFIKQLNKERNIYNFLLEKEEELKQINLGEVVKEELKQQKINLNEKHKQEKSIINEKHEREIAKIKSEKNILESNLKNKDKDIRDLQKKVNQLQSSKMKHDEQSRDISSLKEELLNQENECNLLKEQNESLKAELKDSKSKDVTFKDWLHFTMIELKSEMSSLSENELDLAKQIIKDIVSDSLVKELKEEKQHVEDENAVVEEKQEETSEKITHSIQRPTNQKFLEIKINNDGKAVNENDEIILNIPEKMILRKNDLILVDKDNNFKYLFGCKIPDFVDRTKPHYVLRHRYGRFYNADDVLVENVKVYSNFTFDNGQLVIFQQNGDFLANTEKYLLTLETIKEVSDKRKNKIFIVVKKIDDFLVVINPENKKESILKLDNISDFDMVGPYASIITDEEESKILHSFLSPLFYKLSPYYDKKYLGVIKIDNGLTYVRDITDEDIDENYQLLSMDYSPNYTLNTGFIVWYDEDYNFLYKEKSNQRIDAYKKNPNTNNKKPVKKQENKNELPDVEENILIIGNPSNRIAYQLGFRKFGIDAKTVDGYANYTAIKREMKNVDKIVFLANFASHDNQAKIKLEPNINIYYPKKDGVNYIYNEIYNS